MTKLRTSYRKTISKFPMSQRKSARFRLKKVFKNKYVRTGILTTATVGTVLAVLPKETIEKAATNVQNLGESVYDLAENLGETTGSIVKAVGSSVDGLSNGLGFISENFNTFIFVTGLTFTGIFLKKIHSMIKDENY